MKIIKKFFFGLLILLITVQILFLILKISNVVSWRWQSVFIPSFVIIVFVMVLFLFTMLTCASENDNE